MVGANEMSEKKRFFQYQNIGFIQFCFNSETIPKYFRVGNGHGNAQPRSMTMFIAKEALFEHK